MKKFHRVCVPLTHECNLKCKYCYNRLEKAPVPETLTSTMKTFLSELSPEFCISVIASGGEPLLRETLMKEMFSYVPANVNKKIMTNGLLLTEELVEWANDARIEVLISHDGDTTEFLRGVDVLRNSKQAALIKKIQMLTISGVCTNRNPNPFKNMKQTEKLLGRSNFLYQPAPVYFNGLNQDLIDGFNYAEFQKGVQDVNIRTWRLSPFYEKKERGHIPELNIALNGDIIDKDTIEKYSDVTAKEHIEEITIPIYKNAACFSTCPVRNKCQSTPSKVSEHYCKIIRILGGLL